MLKLPEFLLARPDLDGQHALLGRIVSTLIADERCLAAWLGGSLARGEGDSYSDVDVGVAVEEASYASFLADWEALLDRISPTVLKRSLRLGDTNVLTGITTNWQRFDVSPEPLSTIGQPFASPRAMLFDRAEIQRRFGPLTAKPSVPPDRLAGLVEEFWRVLGLLVVVIGREEFLVGMDGVMLLRRYLIDLMLLETGAQRGGALRLNAFLTLEQRHLLEPIPPLSPTRESVMAGHVAYTRAFRPLALRLMDQHGLSYPERFEQATLEHVKASLRVALF